MKKVGIVCCSNAQRPETAAQNRELAAVLRGMGFETVFSGCLYARDGVRSGTARQRADALMDFYRDGSVDMICDFSGGDIANEILDSLDYGAISRHPKPLWGYSDLTAVLNAVWTCSGVGSVLFQIKNLVSACGDVQQARFAETMAEGKETLFAFPYRFLQGEQMQGIVLGGNVRCLLKLAGTKYFPDLTGKILLMEAYGGETARLIAYFSQLKQLGAFEKAAGVVLGTFTQMSKNPSNPPVFEVLRAFIDPRLPVAQTEEIGHGADARAVRIGEWMRLERKPL